MLYEWVQKLPGILTGDQQNLYDNCSLNIFEGMECDTPSLSP